MSDICIVIIFLISLISGLLSIRAVNRFMEGKIKQWSFEYQVFGFCGALSFVFGMIIVIGESLGWIISKIVG